ncbi:hypothetical protein [Chamaesiphon sp.]|uniref:hypothetical protein n=1 Tax=Chamaesiphon sp. TaxID=2814140 RepID=UPI003593E931
MAILPLLKKFLPRPKEIPDLPDLMNEVLNSARQILPPATFKLLDEIEDKQTKDLKDLKCQLDKESKVGQDTQCAKGSRDADYRESLQLNKFANKPKELKSSPRKIPFKFPERGLIKGSNLSKSKVNQNQDIREGNYTNTIIKFQVPPSPFDDDFDPNNPNSTLGNKALLFDVNGRVLKTANSIARDGRALDISSNLAASTPIRLQSANKKNAPKTEIKNLKDAIDKMKGTGEINSLASLFAAITGMVAIIAVVAVLVPLSFLTVALNWLQTVTTMFTNVNNIVTTYLSMTDAGLSLFGYPKSTDKIKKTVNGIAYGLFGKENYEQAKAAFAQGILNLTSMTKLLEKIESGRRGTNSKIDEVAFSLGTANNALKEGGLIPPDSPWNQYSEKVDKFVDAQSKASTDPDLKENIQKLTSEIQTSEEVDKEIKSETEARDKIVAQKQKEVDNIKNLGLDVKPLIEKQINEARE